MDELVLLPLRLNQYSGRCAFEKALFSIPGRVIQELPQRPAVNSLNLDSI